MAIDILSVLTTTFRVLFVRAILSHDRRRILHTNVTEHPMAAWTAQQIVEAFGLDAIPKYLLRDRDAIYGPIVSKPRCGGLHHEYLGEAA